MNMEFLEYACIIARKTLSLLASSQVAVLKEMGRFRQMVGPDGCAAWPRSGSII